MTRNGGSSARRCGGRRWRQRQFYDHNVSEVAPTDPAPERWKRSDWWGVVLDAPDVGALARFYCDLRGWTIWRHDDNTASLDTGDGVAYLAVQRNENYVRPTWPATTGEQQMMMHLDFEVTDLTTSVAHAISLGAALAAHQPHDNVRVLLDPAGHPFCLYTSAT